MKKIPVTFVIALLVNIASCQQVEQKSYELRAKAVDMSGNAIAGIQVITGRLELVAESPIPVTNPVTTDPLVTDASGEILIKFDSVPEAGGNVSFYREGYYSTQQRVL